MTTQTLPLTGTYKLDPERTTIKCDCKAMMGLFTVHGTFRLDSGQVTIAAAPTACAVSAVIIAGSFASGNSTRDADVVSKNLLDARAYPEIIFSGTGARSRDDGDGWVLAGSVTAHGVTQPVEVQVTDARAEGGTARFRATATLDRLNFGITKMKQRVGHTVHLTIDAVGVPA
jgi:polyisoprenoid-binding protein YceI